MTWAALARDGVDLEPLGFDVARRPNRPITPGVAGPHDVLRTHPAKLVAAA